MVSWVGAVDEEDTTRLACGEPPVRIGTALSTIRAHRVGVERWVPHVPDSQQGFSGVDGRDGSTGRNGPATVNYGSVRVTNFVLVRQILARRAQMERVVRGWWRWGKRLRPFWLWCLHW